jgi:hypothetical protein
MVRKQRIMSIDEKLIQYSDEFDNIFKEIHGLSYEFIMELNQDVRTNFNTIYEKSNNRINEFANRISKMRKAIREFGIY